MDTSRAFFRLFGFWIASLCFLPAPAPAAAVFNVDLGAANFGNLKQTDVTNCGAGGLFACGPTAAVNSLFFLQKQYPGIYDSKLLLDSNRNGFDYQDLIDTANALSDPAFMDCAVCNGGTFLSKFISGKMKWIESKLPGRTVYQDRLNPLWQFVFDELGHKEDVELLFGFYDAAGTRIGGHYVTLTSFMWTDTNMDGIVDVGEGAALGFIDAATGMLTPSSLFQGALGSVLRTDYGVGQFIDIPGRGRVAIAQTRIDSAISESPIPEPDTVALLALGLACLVARHWRRERVR